MLIDLGSFTLSLTIASIRVRVDLTDLTTILVIPFYGESEKQLIWSEMFFAKAKPYGFKDLLLGKLSIPKSDNIFDEFSAEGKRRDKIIE